MKTIKFFTLGCKVNQYDTQVIRERFLGRGFKELEDGRPADIYVVNTCTVTHRADSESLSLIRRAKRENAQARIIVTGCLTELDGDKIKKENGVNLIIQPRRLNGFKGISYFKAHTRAFLKIQDGCDNHCAYCKVPLVRGKPRSKPLQEIIAEAQRIAANGYKEIVLTGICLGAYGRDLEPPLSLVDAVSALEEDIAGLLRIRLSSIEAGDVSDGLIRKMNESKKLCPHLHIPMQSGDDEILKKMNRKYTQAGYLELIRKIKKLIPGVAITTDVLVGFPGESEESFQNTLKLIKEILPLKVHIFPYSKRAGTLAYNFKDNTSADKIKARIARLKAVALGCALKYKSRFIHKNMDVLIESRSKENSCFWQGYTDNYIKVLVKSSLNLKNQFISLRLKKIIKDYILAE